MGDRMRRAGGLVAIGLLASACGGYRSYQNMAPPSVAYAASYPMAAATSMPAQGMPAATVAAPDATANSEAYAHRKDNAFVDAGAMPLSTFSVDVDTASYSNVRRILREGRLPPADAVRIEEMLNYFTYAYAPPKGEAPVAVALDAAPCPWEPSHRLVRLGLKARTVDMGQVGPRNLVFLLDVSGSMMPPNRLPMIKQAMRTLVDQLEARDSLAIVVYAGASGLVLPPTAGDRKGEILAALDSLQAGGSTNGGAGIELAYKVAQQAFRPNGVNRVILASDGDFNVGVSGEAALGKLIEEKRKSGVFLTVLGVGEGNLKDSHMEALADKGNGNYAYLDSLQEARKVLGTQAGSTLVTVAKDVKLQVEFNPAMVQSYRLIGYENRVLANQDFKDDAKDAGDMGAGHTVTALYEVVPAKGVTTSAPLPPVGAQPADGKSAWMTVHVRYKSPESSQSQELAAMQMTPTRAPDADTVFASAVAEFGLLLRQSPHRGAASYDHVLLALAEQERGGAPDPHGYRVELRQLVETARRLSGSTPEVAR